MEDKLFCPTCGMYVYVSDETLKENYIQCQNTLCGRIFKNYKKDE